MKAIQIPAISRLQVVDIPEPATVNDDEVLLQIKYVGFCGSDLNTFRGFNPLVHMPIIPGHEVGAVVAKVGKNVPVDLKIGESVTLNPYTNCGKCSSCRNGRVNACKNNETYGVQRDGAMREYLALPWQKVIEAKNLTPKVCALVEPMSVGFHAVSRGCVSDIDTVMVIGCGMIGMGAIVRASLRGATVIAVDMDDEKLEIAKKYGAKYTINSKTENVHGKVQECTDGFGADVVIEAVGSPVTYVMAIDEVGFTGRVVCIGYSKKPVSFETKYFVQKELNICGSRNAMPNDFRAVINYLSREGSDVSQFITRVVKPEDAFTAMTEWSANPARVFRILVEF